MKLKCEKCQREATVHLTEITNGQKVEKHLCEDCAAAEGVTIKAQVPIAKLLEDLMAQSAAEKELGALKCDVCGMTFLEFRKHGLLGCPHDYEAFASALNPLLERAHQGGSAHVGKAPANAAAGERRQNQLLRLRGQLKQAVAAEDYELAARLRDQIKALEGIVNIPSLVTRQAQWLTGTGPDSDVVISSRVRLARNLAGMPFLTRCGEAQLRELSAQLQRVLENLPLGEAGYADVDRLEPLDRQLLVERHLISRQHAEAKGPRGVGIAMQETMAVMVNEEDHVRMQALRGGLALDACYSDMRLLDELLEGQVSFAFSSRLGYLTACPTNVGTGLRVSVMLHLPGLKMTGQIEKALRAARDMRLAVRGLYGEGTEAVGDFFQFSNQITLGRSEEQLLSDFRDQIVPALVQYERAARQALLAERKLALEDKVHRALAMLRSARLMSTEEAMYLFSHVRLGLGLELLSGVTMQTLNELVLLTQPAHLQRLTGRELDAAARGRARAQLIRQRLGDNPPRAVQDPADT